MTKSILLGKPTSYHILNLDVACTKLVLCKLASAPNSSAEASYNAIALCESKAIMESLRKLDTHQLDRLAHICSDAVSYTVNMNILANRIRDVEQASNRYKEQIERTHYLIRHKASNQMILNLCTLITLEDIKTIRTELNIPVVKGRLKMPSIETRIAIQQAWYDSRHELDCFERYCQLREQFSYLDFGQLHTIVTDTKLSGER